MSDNPSPLRAAIGLGVSGFVLSFCLVFGVVRGLDLDADATNQAAVLAPETSSQTEALVQPFNPGAMPPGVRQQPVVEIEMRPPVVPPPVAGLAPTAPVVATTSPIAVAPVPAIAPLKPVPAVAANVPAPPMPAPVTVATPVPVPVPAPVVPVVVPSPPPPAPVRVPAPVAPPAAMAAGSAPVPPAPVATNTAAWWQQAKGRPCRIDWGTLPALNIREGSLEDGKSIRWGRFSKNKQVARIYKKNNPIVTPLAFGFYAANQGSPVAAEVRVKIGRRTYQGVMALKVYRRYLRLTPVQ